MAEGNNDYIARTGSLDVKLKNQTESEFYVGKLLLQRLNRHALNRVKISSDNNDGLVTEYSNSMNKEITG